MVCSCYTKFVLKNVTITLPEEVAYWARKRAAEENTSVSRLVGKMLEAQMRQTDDYQEAYRRWRELKPMDIDAEHRLTREEAHARR
jgi:hypothetical protein